MGIPKMDWDLTIPLPSFYLAAKIEKVLLLIFHVCYMAVLWVAVLRTCVCTRHRMSRQHRPCTCPSCNGPSPQFIGGWPFHDAYPWLLFSKQWNPFPQHQVVGFLLPALHLVCCLVPRISLSSNESGSLRGLPPMVLCPCISPQLQTDARLPHTSSKRSLDNTSGLSELEETSGKGQQHLAVSRSTDPLPNTYPNLFPSSPPPHPTVRNHLSKHTSHWGLRSQHSLIQERCLQHKTITSSTSRDLVDGHSLSRVLKLPDMTFSLGALG